MSSLYWYIIILVSVVLPVLYPSYTVCIAVSRLGAIARKHGSYASCVRMTNTLYGFNAMEVQEAFVKIREQVIHMSPLSHSDYVMYSILYVALYRTY